ncbi:MAG: outer membrane protein assembly factor BamD [Bacteroidia bacterium]|jgi:outer membrane protein assembly factor BamD
MSARLILFTLLCFSLSTGCEYQKVLKKGTLEQKLDVSRKYYNKGDYARAQIMLEQLVGKFGRGSNAEEVYFLYAYCHFGMNDYHMAAYHFQNFAERYPQSKYHEQAAFMIARCEFEKTLVAELDQTNTKKAIEAIQLFINRYPKSESVETGNKLIDDLRSRLHEKAFNTAILYYNMESYLSAYTSFKNAVIDFPDIPEKEKVDFYIVKSAYRYAKQSVTTLQADRYETALEEAQEYLTNYTENKYVKEVTQMRESSETLINSLRSTTN